jgi:hypothetical protein
MLAARTQFPTRRRFLIAIPVTVATALAIWVFVRANHWDTRRSEAVLRQRTDAINASVQRSLAYHLDALRAMADFVGSDNKIDPAAFQRVATGAVVRHFAYDALAWAPAPLDRKPVPIALVEPGTAHSGLAVGTDLAGTPAQADKLSTARHNGEAVSIASPGEGKRLWVFVPAPGRNGEQGIQGFFGAALRLDLMVDRAVSEFGRDGVAVELRESGSGRSLFRMPANVGSDPFVSLAGGNATLTVADRTFVLAPVVSKAALAGQQSAEVWVVLLAGMLFVALLEGVLLVAATRPIEIESVDLTWPEARLRRG